MKSTEINRHAFQHSLASFFVLAFMFCNWCSTVFIAASCSREVYSHRARILHVHLVPKLEGWEECGRSYLEVAHLPAGDGQSTSVQPEREGRLAGPGHAPEREPLPGRGPLPAGVGAGGCESGHACGCGHAGWPGLVLELRLQDGPPGLQRPGPQDAHALSTGPARRLDAPGTGALRRWRKTCQPLSGAGLQHQANHDGKKVNDNQ